jgi:hypothetical protein
MLMKPISKFRLLLFPALAAFGPASVLFVADSHSGAVFALDVKETGRDETAEKIELKNIDRKIASLLGTTPDAVAINDMVVHRPSQSVYLSVSRGRGNDARPVILKATRRGTTLAELGGGNHPLDMIAFERDGKQRVLISNSDRTLMSISAEDIDRAQPVTTPVSAAYMTSGVPYLAVAEVGVLQLDDLNAGFAVVTQRNIQDGSLNLRSIPKCWL